MNVFELFATIGLDSSEFDAGLAAAGSKVKNIAGVIGDTLATAAKVGAAAIAAASGAVVAMTEKAVKGYAEYEQLVGGVETLFKDSAGTVQKYAEEAYKTAGLSANEYMETVTSFASSLIQATGRGTQQNIDELKASLEDSLKETKRSYDDDYQALKASWDEKIKLAQSGATEAASATKGQKDEELKAVKARNKDIEDAEKERLTEVYNEQKRFWDEQIKEEKARGGGNADAIKQQKEAELAELKKSNAEQLAALKASHSAEYEQIKQSWDDRIKADKAGGSASAEELRAQRDEELKALKRSNEDKLAELKAYNKEQLEAAQAANEFSESTSESLGVAAEVANMAIIDMADNVNKMGSSMESVQNAYMGFSKQNYTMLDNLKLGYGGTKTEMERLLRDAEKFTGIKYDIQNLADVYKAIHAIQDKLKIMGATAEEAHTTISGSFKTMQTAWENLVTGFARGDASIDQLLANFVESAELAFRNVLPVAEKAVGGIAKFVDGIAPIIKQKLPGLVDELLPAVMGVASTIVGTIIGELPIFVQIIIDQLPEILGKLWNAAMSILWEYIPGVAVVFVHIRDVIEDNLPGIISVLEGLGTAIFGVFGWLFEHGSVVISVLSGIIGGFMAYKTVTGVIEAVSAAQAILNAVMNANPFMLVITIIAGLVTALLTLWNTNEDFRIAVTNIWDALMIVFGKVGEVINSVVSVAVEKFNALKDAAVERFNAVKEAAASKFNAVKDAVGGAVKAMWENTKERLGKIKQAYDEHGGGINGVVAAYMETMRQKYAAIYEAINSLTGGKLGEIASTMKEKMDSAVQAIRDKLQSLKDMFANLASDAWEWGKDLIRNFIDGIKEKATDIKNTFIDVANSIKDFIGFSEPKKGPLSNFHTYAPDMMDLFANGIRDNEKLVTNQIANSFDFSDIAEIGGGVGIGTASALGNAGGTNTTYSPVINIYGSQGQDVKELAERVGEVLERMYRSQTRVYA